MKDTDLQDLLDQTATRLGVVGAQLAIYDGSRERNFATGYRNRELGLAVTPDTLFQIGSITKVFNAALILKLVDAGRLDLDTPVCEYIHDFNLADPNAQQSISLRHLLSMTAGLDNGPYYDYGRGNDALGRYVDCLAGIPQLFDPGSAFGYSNASTNVAGHAAAVVMGQTWERLLTEHICAPLELKHSALFAEDLLMHPVALGYKKMIAKESIQRSPLWCLPRSMGPAGSLTCCSAIDLIRFARMFLDQGRSMLGTQVLSRNAVDSMQSPQIQLPTRILADEWCVGPYRKHYGGHALYGHHGTNYSGSAMLLWYPEKHVAIATTVNVASQGYPLADAILDVVFPAMFDINRPRAPTPDTVTRVTTDLSPYIGRFEAFGLTQTLKVAGGKLKLDSVTTAPDEPNVTNCELIPLGDGRFLPCDLSVSGNRNWDIAFWGRNSVGKATHLLQGVFALRRTG